MADDKAMDIDMGSKPSGSEVVNFLASLAKDNSSQNTAVERKIIQLKAQRKKTRERINKRKQRMREQVKLLRMDVQDFKNLTKSISKLNDLKHKPVNDSDSD